MARLIEGELLSSAFLPPSQAAAIAAGDEVAKEAARALASQPHIFFSAHGLPEKYVTRARCRRAASLAAPLPLRPGAAPLLPSCAACHAPAAR